MEGKWQDLDTSACPYISETTRLLQQFAQVRVKLHYCMFVEVSFDACISIFVVHVLMIFKLLYKS